uniref:Uncharacterized protein n=1 Tax=viral metagenome TaxID=1070528 RepID=A0A6M3LL49_9ZZZZ
MLWYAEMENDEDIQDMVDDDFEPEPERLEREHFLEKFTTALHDPLGDLRWVFQALGAKNLQPQDAPSAGAWGLLTALQGDELMLKSFYATIYPKLLPSKSQIDKGNDHVDDGRKLFGIIDQLLREPADDADILSDTEKRARQLALQAAGTPSGL